MKIKDRVCVITGAASGIGRALAVALARKRAILALADRNVAGLEETRALLGKAGAHATLHALDVSDETAVSNFSLDVLAAHGRVDILINNAGVALFGTIAEITTDEMKWLFDINFWGTVYGTKAFLPTLVAQPEACIVNISSIFGIYAPPGQSAYAASKFAVRGFTESLRGELAETNVHVCTVHPGGIATAIARSARVAQSVDPERAAKMTARFETSFLTATPDEAATAIVRGIRKNKNRVVIGADARKMDVAARLFPETITEKLGRNAKAKALVR